MMLENDGSAVYNDHSGRKTANQKAVGANMLQQRLNDQIRLGCLGCGVIKPASDNPVSNP